MKINFIFLSTLLLSSFSVLAADSKANDTQPEELVFVEKEQPRKDGDETTQPEDTEIKRPLTREDLVRAWDEAIVCVQQTYYIESDEEEDSDDERQ